MTSTIAFDCYWTNMRKLYPRVGGTLRYDLPLLVVATVPRPLIDIHAISGAVANNIQHLAAVLGFELVVTAHGNQLPTLVGTSSTRPLLHVRPIGGGYAAHIQALAAIAVDDVVITAAHAHKAP